VSHPFKSRGQCSTLATPFGGSGTGSGRPLTPLHTFQVAWPLRKVPLPSFAVSVRPERASPPPLLMPQIGDFTDCPYPTLRLGPVHAQRGHDNPPRQILAQGSKVDHKLLLSHAHRDTLGGVMPPTLLPPGHPPAKAGGAQGGLLPSQCQPGNGPPPPLLSFAFGAPGASLLAGLNHRPIVRLPPPTVEDPQSRPPDQKPPAGGRGGPSDNTLHPWAIWDAHDQFSHGRPDPHPHAPVPNGLHLFRPEEKGNGSTPHGVGLPVPDPGVLPAPSRPVPKAVDGLGQIRSRENRPDESWKRLPGRPADLEVLRCRHLVPPLRLGT